MAGIKQHFIPRSLLRGFLSAARGRTEKVWVFRRDKIFNPALDGAAAQRFFYSGLPTDGNKTLDEQITAYEDKLAPLIQSLRDLPAGSVPDARAAAEIVTHLCIRSAHLRAAFTRGFEHISLHAGTLLSDNENLRALMGVDDESSNSKFSAMVGETIDKDPRFSKLPFPKDLVRQIFTTYRREQFSNFVPNDKPQIRGLLAYLFVRAKEFSQEAHNKALAKSFAPEPRIADLSKLDWRIIQSSNPLILPDCVALAIEETGDVQPFMLAELDKLSLVLMPLSADKLLVGERVPFAGFVLEHFNLLAAGRSHEFFVANTNTEEIARLSQLIGSKAHVIVDRAIAEALDNLLSKSKPVPPLEENEDLLLVPDYRPEELTPANPLRLTTHFPDGADADTAQKISDEVGRVVSVVHCLVPLGQLEGITFANDYPGALRKLAAETGAPPGSMTPTEKRFGESVSMAPIVMRDGVMKTHIVMQAWLGHALIADNTEARDLAINTFVGQLANVGCHELIDRTFPNLRTIEGAHAFDAWKYNCTASAWTGYFAARIGALFGADAGPPYRQLLGDALKEMQVALPAARLDYRFHGDLDRLMKELAACIGPTLQFAARLIGHYDGLDDGSLNEELEKALRALNLFGWYDTYQRDLRKFWSRRGKWESSSELLALNPHVDRLLWQYGIFAWTIEDGRYRVMIPLASDARALGPAMGRRPLQTLRVLVRSLGRAVLNKMRSLCDRGAT